MSRIFTFLAVCVLLISTQSTKAQIVRSNFTGVIVPKYMTPGNAGGANPGTLPYIFRATVSGLLPNFTYKYFTGAARTGDIGGTTVVGGTVYINPVTGVISY